MTKEIIAGLKAANKRIKTEHRKSKKNYDRLDRKSRTASGLDFEESEQHDFEDGYSSALWLALEILKKELLPVGIKF